jgi:hypothetical protein
MHQPSQIRLGDTLAQSYFLKVHSIRERDACILRWCLPAWMKLSNGPPVVGIIDNYPERVLLFAMMKRTATGIIALILFDLPPLDGAKGFRRNASW